MSASKLFEPCRLGAITLPNRAVMAPLRRNRAVAGMVPNPLAAEYYGQRASAGLIVTEGSQVSQQGQGYQDSPGIYSKEQVTAWREVTDRVHARGGHIFLQLWHAGRISHTSLQPGGDAPAAPSAIKANTKTLVNGASTEVSEPRALPLEEIPGIIESFKRARPTHSTPASMASRFTAPTATCSTSSPKTAPTSAPMPMAEASRIARG